MPARGNLRTVVSVAALVVVALMVGSTVGLVAAHPGPGADQTDQHLWAHIDALDEPGTINASGNPLHWTKLKGVPPGIADGLDDDRPPIGFGLEYASPAIGTVLRVNTTEIQRRVGSCASGDAIRSVNQDGSVVCEPTRPLGHQYVDGNVGSLNSESFRSVGALALPAGTFMVWAKLVVEATSGPGQGFRAVCRLVAGSQIDVAEIWGEQGVHFVDTLSMLSAAGSGSPWTADVQCRDFGSDLDGRDLRILAIPADAVTTTTGP